MSGPGEIVGKLYECADPACQQRARTMMSSIGEAATAVRAAEALAEANKQSAVAENAASPASDAKEKAAPFDAAKDVASATQTPREAMAVPCANCWAAKKQRMADRAALSESGSKSDDPKVKAAAQRLTRNTESVELAKLSDDAYAQYPPTPNHQPPTGWAVVSDGELEAKGIDKDLLTDSRAVMYRSEPDWPGGQKTVLAFRGTADEEDVIVDHDQAMGLPTRQYEAATRLGTRMSDRFGNEVLVTGHSLGGGKAQAAGATGGLKGMMFNSAGLHPNTVEGEMPSATQFQQYRTPGDPLTGVQNSGALQTLAAGLGGTIALPLGAITKAGDGLLKVLGFDGLSPEKADYADKALMVFPRAVKNLFKDGYITPPAIGPITEVPSIDESGNVAPLLNPKKQHKMTFLINGIEQQKSEDMATLKPSS